MTSHLKIGSFKNGKFTFLEQVVYELIKETLGFRYNKISKEFFKMENGNYRVAKFQHIRDDFHLYLKNNFDEIEIEGEISKDGLLEEYYRQMPIKNSDFIRIILGKELN